MLVLGQHTPLECIYPHFTPFSLADDHWNLKKFLAALTAWLVAAPLATLSNNHNNPNNPNNPAWLHAPQGAGSPPTPPRGRAESDLRYVTLFSQSYFAFFSLNSTQTRTLARVPGGDIPDAQLTPVRLSGSS